MVPEVVIDVKPGHPSYEKFKQDSIDNHPRKRIRRSIAKTVVISDDEAPQSSSDYEDANDASPPPVPKSKKTQIAKGMKRKRVVDSDDEFSAEETDSDDPPPATSDDDESVVSIKSSGKIKKTGKKMSSRSTTASADEDSMSVDEAPGKVKKEKASKVKGDSEDRPAKRQKRTDSDPWKLGSRAVKNDWKQMHAPPFEMFHFARKVVDEYTYLDGKIHSLVTSITAERHWVLSGTPPIHDFAALKTIAAFLNLHLGVDDDGEGRSTEVKKRRREQTGMCVLYQVNSPLITCVQLWRSSTLSVRFILSSGMRIGINLVRHS